MNAIWDALDALTPIEFAVLAAAAIALAFLVAVEIDRARLRRRAQARARAFADTHARDGHTHLPGASVPHSSRPRRDLDRRSGR